MTAKIIRLEPGNAAARRAYGRRPTFTPTVEVDENANQTDRFLKITKSSKVTVNPDGVPVSFVGKAGRWVIEGAWFGIDWDNEAGSWNVWGGGIDPFHASDPVGAVKVLRLRGLLKGAV